MPDIYTYANGDESPPKGWAFISTILGVVPVLGANHQPTGKTRYDLVDAIIFHDDTADGSENKAKAYLSDRQLRAEAKTAAIEKRKIGTKER